MILGQESVATSTIASDSTSYRCYLHHDISDSSEALSEVTYRRQRHNSVVSLYKLHLTGLCHQPRIQTHAKQPESHLAKIDIGIEHAFIVPVNRSSTWAFLIDTPKTVGHYPKLDKLVELGNNCWQWELQELGGKGFSHQIVYAVEYHFDEAAGSIIWEPIADRGNSVIRGAFQLTDHAEGTHVVLSTSGQLDVPVPGLLKAMAKPYVKGEFTSQIETFAANLRKAIGNEKGV